MARAMKMTFQLDVKTIINQKSSLWSSQEDCSLLCMLSTLFLPARFNYAISDKFFRLPHFYLSPFCCNLCNDLMKLFSLISHLFSFFNQTVLNCYSLLIRFSIEVINKLFFYTQIGDHLKLSNFGSFHCTHAIVKVISLIRNRSINLNF